MPSWKTLFKSENYISAVEFGDKKPTLTIAKIGSAKLEGETGKEKDKGVIWFKEIERGWVFSKTSGFCISALFGDDFTKWVGKRVTLHSEMVQVGARSEPGIRVTGSPDIQKPITIKIKLPKKKAFEVKLIPTQAKGSPELKDPEKVPAPADASAPPPESAAAATTGPEAQPQQ